MDRLEEIEEAWGYGKWPAPTQPSNRSDIIWLIEEVKRLRPYEAALLTAQEQDHSGDDACVGCWAGDTLDRIANQRTSESDLRQRPAD